MELDGVKPLGDRPELLFAPFPMTEGEQMPSIARAGEGGYLVWCDVDHRLNWDQQELIERLDAWLLESGTPGRRQVFIRLDSATPAHHVEALNRALCVPLKGDPSKVVRSAIMRLPGSFNTKGGKSRVARIVRESERVWSAPELAQRLGAELPDTDTHAHTMSPRRASSGALRALEPSKPNNRAERALRAANSRFESGNQSDRDGVLWGLYKDLARSHVVKGVPGPGVTEGGHILWYALRCEAAKHDDRWVAGDVARFLVSHDYAGLMEQAEGDKAGVPHQPESVGAGVSDEPEEPAAPVQAIPEAEFWEARPELKHIRDFARMRLVSPWAVLGVVLARVATAVPQQVVLPPIVGTPASLNLYVAIADDSGIGKGTAMGTARECLEFPYTIQSINLGSGEGIGHQYMERKDGELHQHTEAVMFNVHEIDTLTAMQGRSASTITPTLCSAWVGEPLGFAYVDKAKRLPMNEHTYRLTLVCGVQPKRARSLIDAAGSGLPQRFLWFPALDLGAPELKDDADEMAPREWRLPAGEMERALNAGRYVFRVADPIRRQIRKERSDRMRGVVQVAELDSHRNLSRLKAAAILALINGRADVSEEDWELSSVLMAVSDQTRGRVVETLGRVNAEDARSRGKLRGVENIAATEEVHKVNDAEDWAWRKIKAEGSVPEGELKRRCPARFKEYLPEALSRLRRDGKRARPEQGKRKDSVIWVKI
ncbi:DUF3987 domain-containing protein [Streptomyces sp. NPDC002587]